LRKTLRDLNRIGRTKEVHAAVLGYLKNPRNPHEVWMYEALAAAIELNNGSAADVKRALNFAADIAQASHNPNLLFSAADKLFFRDHLERVGPLLDEVMPLVPHRIEPIVMSVNLALKTKDPVRMADAVERIFSLGWPGQDDYFRQDAANQVDSLAKTLREDGKVQEADQLLAKLGASQSRDVFVRLSWDGDADFDLNVDEPLGATANYQTPRTVFGGSIVKNGYHNNPEEVYVCPRGFDGDYIIRVTTIYANEIKPVTRLTLETIVHEGTDSEKKETRNLNPDKSNSPIVVHLTGGRRKKVLPFVDPNTELMKAAVNALKKPPANELKKPPANAKGKKP
jgi:hypothetical protein